MNGCRDAAMHSFDGWRSEPDVVSRRSVSGQSGKFLQPKDIRLVRVCSGRFSALCGNASFVGQTDLKPVTVVACE